jgi:FkbM family methyltransferase
MLKSIKNVFRPYKTIYQDQRDRVRLLLRQLMGKELRVRREAKCRATRVGVGDGAWFICPDRIERGGQVYSFGVGADISFDLAMIQQFGVEIHAFDPTPISRQWLEQQTLPSSFHFHPIGLAGYDGIAKFELPRGHYVSFTMLGNIEGSQSSEGEVCRLQTILERFGHERITLVKLDVEGAEYDVLSDLAICAQKIDQLLIEFHHRMVDGQAGLERTRRALSVLRDAGFRLFKVSPRGLEYSFIQHI